MTAVHNMFFVLQFLAFMIIIFVELFHILGGAKLYDLRISFMLFVGALISYGVGFVTMLIDYDTLLFSRIFQLQSWLLILFVMLFVVDLLLYFQIFADTTIQAYNPNKK